jgi:hypothetical protein
METIAMIFGGRYFCRMRELRPIDFSYELLASTATSMSVAAQVPERNTVIVHENENA